MPFVYLPYVRAGVIRWETDERTCPSQSPLGSNEWTIGAHVFSVWSRLELSPAPYHQNTPHQKPRTTRAPLYAPALWARTRNNWSCCRTVLLKRLLVL